MGGACSGKISQSKQIQKQQELNMVEQPYLQEQKMSQPQSKPLEIRSELGQSLQELLQIYKQFTDFLGLVDNFDHLPAHTREQLNNCIIQRSNINILIQNSIKRIMKEQKIIKRVEESDYYLIYNDKKFATMFVQLMKKISNIILDQLQADQNFQEAFPMLIVSFVKIATQISREIENLQSVKTQTIKNQNHINLNSQDFYQVSTNK